MIVELLTWLLVWVSGAAAGWHLAMRRTVPKWNREREAFFDEHRGRVDAIVDRYERRHRDLRKQLGLEPEELQ